MDDDEIPNISSLEDAAFLVSFKEILSNLILCSSHRPEGMEMPCSSLLPTIPNLESEQLLDIVRSRLDKYLVGIMGDKIRKKYVNQFYSTITEYSCTPEHDSDFEDPVEDDKDRREECVVDLWAFLDCVLDNSFEELTTHIAFPGCEPNNKLISTIANRCPLLKQLALNFSLMKSETKPTILRPVVLSLGSLVNLTDLTLGLVELDVQLREILLSLVGNSCPFLSKLDVLGDEVFKKKEICSIFMGELAYDTIPRGSEEPEWLSDDEFSRLKVPEKFLVPMCFTLKELRLSGYRKSKESTFLEMYESSAIFILRHLPLLEKLELPLPTAVVIKSLSKQSQVKFEKDFETSFQRRTRSPSEPNLKSTFIGALSLTRVDGINARDREMLRAVAFFCPLLKEASFLNPLAFNDPGDLVSSTGERYVIPQDVSSPEELESILSEYPKLTKLTLKGFQPNYVAPILKVFGTELTELKISTRCELNVPNLLACPKLEILHLDHFCSLLEPSNTDSPQIQSTFLPQLRELDSEICLGSWSHLFLNKASLAIISLRCCHIGCKEEESSRRPKKRFRSEIEVNANWSQTPQMWPRLEDLSFRSCAGLTMAMVGNLAPQFPKLKYFWLPNGFQSKEPHLSMVIRDQLSRRKPPIILGSCDDYGTEKCPFVDKYEEAKNGSKL